MNESPAYQGRKLKRNNLVNACYTRDGIVTIKINERSKASKIHHMNDLLELFPNFDFEDEPFDDAPPDISRQPMYWVGFGSLRTCAGFYWLGEKDFVLSHDLYIYNFVAFFTFWLFKI